MPQPLSHGLLLTAGLGTRLRPLTMVRAKPAVPLAGEALARRIVRWLAGYGVTDLVLNLHHLPATVTTVLGDGSDLGASVRYSWEQPTVLGSAGGPRRALEIIGAETFLIVNGDTLTDVDLSALAAAHTSSGALVTLALVPNEEPLRYGGVHLAEGNRVIGFVAAGPNAKGSYHFVGVQVASADVFRPLSIGRPSKSIGGLYDTLIAARPDAIRGFVSHASSSEIGTVADYWKMSHTLVAPDAPAAHLWGHRVRVDSSAIVQRSILWDDIDVGRNVVLEECIITDGVLVPAGAAYRRCVLVQTDNGVVATPFETPQ